MNAKLDDTTSTINEMNTQKSRSQDENADLTHQLEDAESEINQLGKIKSNLAKNLEENRNNLEEETRMRAKLQSEVRNLQSDLEQLREQLEEEQEGRADLQRALNKANNEMNIWRQKFESGEGGVRSEEFEELKRKMNAKLAEAESALEAAQSKASSLDKAKHRLQGELEDVMIEMERVCMKLIK